MSLFSTLRASRNRLIGCALLLGLFGPVARADLFSLHIYETDAALALRTANTPAGAAYWAAYAGIGERLQKAGVLRGGGAFRTGEAIRRVSAQSGKAHVQMGAHARSAEKLGGTFLIEVPTLDEALRWAAEIPAAQTGGTVEVIPHYPVPGMMAPPK